MKRAEFIKAVAEKAEMTQKATKEVLEVMQEVVYAEMAKGEEVKIFDSVTLLGKEVPEREARNPQTGDTIVVPAHLAPKAKFGTGIKNLLKED
jgi:DNA-binding protein HU-beta